MHVFRLTLLFTLLSLLALPATAQKEDFDDESDATWKEVYTTALQYGDTRVAINALYKELAEHPNSLALKDSLSSLYFASGAFSQAIAVGGEILEEKPKDTKILELVAISYQNLGAIKKSLETYETLYAETEMVYHLYQLAVLQYQLKRYGECQLSLQQVIKNPKSEEEKVVININQRYRQEVPLNAAAFNVMGVLFKEQNELEKAKQSFQAALQAEPEFALAKGNLQAIQKGQQQGSPQGAGQPAPPQGGGAPTPKPPQQR